MAFTSSIVRYPDRGPWGSASYPGNATGHLVKDFIETYHPSSVLDPMEGSGTTRDVCAELGVPYVGYDLNYGDDIMAPGTRANMRAAAAEHGGFDAIFWHPPYFDIIRYDLVRKHAEDILDNSVRVTHIGESASVEDHRDFSTGGYTQYLSRMQSALTFLTTLLSTNRNARIGVLIGDARHAGRYYWLARDVFDMRKMSAAHLRLESLIIREQKDVTSDVKHYDSNIIRIMHEFFLIMEPMRDNPFT